MDTKKSILIIHPEGNIFNNPNLLSIANYLSDHYQVDVLMPFSKNIGESKFNIIFYRKLWSKFKLKFFIIHHFFAIFFKLFIDFGKYNFIIGIDREGIIDANILSQKYGCSYGLISYELIFQDETSISFKKNEIISCENIKFAIVQDEIRGNFLSIENHIPTDKFIYIPVASSGRAQRKKKTYLLHTMLNIPRSKKILIFTGSVSIWTCINEILDKAELFLPENWVLVIHDRYGKAKENITKMGLDDLITSKIYLTNKGKLGFNDLDILLSDADLGIVSYKEDISSPYTGKNIRYIGMSSGKFSTYMRNGLPVVIYNSEKLGEEVQRNQLGFSCNDLIFLKDFLMSFESKQKYADKCEYYFNARLSFDNYSKLLKDKINSNI